MKVCLKCKHLIDSKMKFCNNCGGSEFIEVASNETTASDTESKPSGQAENQQPSSANTANEAPQKSQNSSSDPANHQSFTQYLNYEETPHAAPYSMNWYKFLIYFALWAGAFGNAVYGILYINGMIYSAVSGGQLTAEMIYGTFKSVQYIDIIHGVLQIARAGVAIYTRFCLAKYKSNGPMCVYVLYGANVVLPLIYNISVFAVTGVNTFGASSIFGLIVSGVVLALNYKYFSKRDFMFVC